VRFLRVAGHFKRPESQPRGIRYQIAFSEAARALPKSVRLRIGHRITQLQDHLSGNVKKLAAHENGYRLGVGSYRVLFRLEGNVIAVYAVKDIGRMRTSKTLEASRAKKPTLQQLAEEVDHLRERVEDLEDLRDLKEAIQRNGDKPRSHWPK
jgi:mRNA interferase RelE/StbE